MGVKLDGQQLHHLPFAVDIVLITPSISQAERMLADFVRVCGKIEAIGSMSSQENIRHTQKITQLCEDVLHVPNERVTSLFSSTGKRNSDFLRA
ncbi:unnamed protein product [Heligmosomoides polygyrus]|uniref:Helicase ATP-binding domain-containing protein n=1 Tax=Heligmosomoides polygyrus TaxID=6339 RepID=A0A183FYG8_HELPZ|nr:unnamed protein product [Heligmosomoides polygyrus]